VVINLSWLGQQLRAALGDGGEYGVHISWSDEGAEPLETGGGILHALPLLGAAPFLVVNADIFTDIDLAPLRLDPDAHAHLVLVPNPEHHPRGDFGLEGDRVVAGEDGQRFTYSGVAVYSPELFAGCTASRFRLLPLLNRAIAQGRARGQLYRGAWSDVGTPARLAQLEERLAAVQ